MLMTWTLVGFAVVAVFVVIYLRKQRQDKLSGMLEKRRGNSKLVTRAHYVEGLETMPVALALTADTFYYENPDLEASFDLNRIDEVEYGDELATGRTVEAHSHVMRLRSHGTMFEFVLNNEDSEKWKVALPPRRLGSGAAPGIARAG